MEVDDRSEGVTRVIAKQAHGGTSGCERFVRFEYFICVSVSVSVFVLLTKDDTADVERMITNVCCSYMSRMTSYTSSSIL